MKLETITNTLYPYITLRKSLDRWVTALLEKDVYKSREDAFEGLREKIRKEDLIDVRQGADYGNVLY